MTNRVVVTGTGSLSPLGNDWEKARSALREGQSGVTGKPEWDSIQGLNGHVVGEVDVDDDNLLKRYPRRSVRSMGRVALLAIRSAEVALREAGLWEDSVLESGDTGISYGSTEGSQESANKFYNQIFRERSIERIKIADFLKLMSHTSGANLAQALGVTGRLVPTSSACTSGSQGIGYGYEAIKLGKQAIMITGGAEELVESAAAVFNVMMEASTYNDDPASTPRPFDRSRDGLVVGEGAGTLVLESLEHARNRGVEIKGELVGFATNCNGGHTTIPSEEGIRSVIEGALADADLSPSDIDFVSAHATATEQGDIAESRAMESVFGSDVPTSALKSYMGHTLGACGAIEATYTLNMMAEGWIAPTLHLDEVDERCGDLDYLRENVRESTPEYVMTNNFAFGGVNTSLIFKRWENE